MGLTFKLGIPTPRTNRGTTVGPARLSFSGSPCASPIPLCHTALVETAHRPGMTTPDLNAIIQLAAIVAEQNSAPEPDASPSPMREEDLPDLLTLAETAQYLRMKPKTLRNWRSLGKGPKALHLGGRVVYRRDDVLAFRDNQAVAA